MKKIQMFLIMILTLLFFVGCATTGAVMNESDEIVEPKEKVQYHDNDQVIWKAFYCDNTDCSPRSGRYQDGQVRMGDPVGCPLYMDIVVGTKRLVPGRLQTTIPITNQFFVYEDSCSARVAEDSEYMTSSETTLLLILLIGGVVVALIGLVLMLLYNDENGSFARSIILIFLGVLIMLSSLLVT